MADTGSSVIITPRACARDKAPEFVFHSFSRQKNFGTSPTSEHIRSFEDTPILLTCACYVDSIFHITLRSEFTPVPSEIVKDGRIIKSLLYLRLPLAFWIEQAVLWFQVALCTNRHLLLSTVYTNHTFRSHV